MLIKIIIGINLFICSSLLFGFSDSSDWKHYPFINPNSKIVFPQDEGSHITIPGIEWWYVAMNVQGTITKNNYSIVVSHFNNMYRIFTISNLSDGSHLSATTMGQLFSKRGKLDLKHFTKFGVDKFKNSVEKNGELIPFEYELATHAKNAGIEAKLVSLKMPAMIGGTGYVNVGRSGSSYYYSLTRLNVTGMIEYNNIREPIIGTGWMDHQWGPFLVSPIEFFRVFESYEWFCVQLDNGYDVMISNIFDRKYNLPQTKNYTSVELVAPDGTTQRTINRQFIRTEYWKDPTSGHVMSMGWRLYIPDWGLFLNLKPTIKNQMVDFPLNGDFWEGSLKVEGIHSGVKVKGAGFGELIHRYQSPVLDLSIKKNTIFSNDKVELNWRVLNPDEGNPLVYEVYLDLLDGKGPSLVGKDIRNRKFVFFIGDYLKEKLSEQSFEVKVVANSIDKSISSYKIVKGRVKNLKL